MFKADQDLREAQSLFEQGRYDETRAIFARLRSPNSHLTPSQNAKLLYQRALLYQVEGHREEARQDLKDLFNEGLHKSQCYNQTLALHSLGKMAYEEGKYEDAVEYFRHELSIWHSKMRDYYLSLSRNFLAQAKCFLELEDWQECAMYLKLAATFAETGEESEQMKKVALIQA